MLIKTHDYRGTDVLLNTDAVISIVEASTSSQWHGIRSIIHLLNGKVVECGERVSTLEEKLFGENINGC